MLCDTCDYHMSYPFKEGNKKTIKEKRNWKEIIKVDVV